MNYKQVYHYLIISLALLSTIALSACGGSGDPDGDECNCENGLICQNGECVCNSEECCTIDDDCPAGTTCNLDSNTCTGNGGDEDTTEDGDIENDGDIEEDGDTEEDGDVEEDGDIVEDSDDDEDIQIDGDTEEDIADGDDDSVVVSKSCRFGLDKLVNLTDLPLFENGTTAMQTSSRDPDEANEDEATRNLYLINQNEHVIMHSKTPGCIYRMWFAEPDYINVDTIRFYFNGDSNASISMNMKEFFASMSNGTPLETPTNPFLPEFAGTVNFTDSYYSYVPICYTSEILVTVSGPQTLSGFQVSYQNHPDCDNLKDFALDMDMTDAVELYNTEFGTDPKPAYPEADTFSGSIPLAAGATTENPILNRRNIPEAEAITSFKLNVTPATEEVLDNLWIDIYWDGRDEKTPANVSAPASLFFGGGYGATERNSLMIGSTASGDFYCYWPMPYWSDVVVKLTNHSSVNISNIDYEFVVGKTDLNQNDAGHFSAMYSKEFPTTPGKDFKALEVQGKGHVVGITMALAPPTTKATAKDFLWGDERIFIDEMNFPLVRGTGTDNFFNGANRWVQGGYEHSLFSVWKLQNSFSYTATRIMLSDSIPYHRSISMGFEVGGENEFSADYRSVVYYYHSCLDGMSQTDEIEMFDSTSEADHDLSKDGLQTAYTELQNLEGSYEGENHSTTTIDSGNGIQTSGENGGILTMTLDIAENNQGVRLVRKLSNKWKNSGASIINQNAIVKVGEYGQTEALMPVVGNWYTAGTNIDKIWQESVFDIPAKFTAGMSQIKVAFIHDEGSTLDQVGYDWNIFNLKAFSFLPNDSSSEGPGVVDSITYSSVGTTPCLSWNAPTDGSSPAFYHIYRSDEDQAFNCETQTGLPSENYVATTSETTWCEPEPLPKANHPYYYRIMAEDCTAKAGTCSDRFLVTTGIEDHCFEAEDIIYYGDQCRPSYEENPEAFVVLEDESYSAGKALYFQSYAAANVLILQDTIEYAGDYDIEITFVKTPNSAIVRLLMLGTPIADSIDLYHYENKVEVMRLDTPYGVNSDNQLLGFQFRVKDDNNSSSGGYHIGIDKICLIGRNIVPDNE